MYTLFTHSNPNNTHLPEISWSLNSINFIHGRDTVKKTLLLKAMYACIKVIEVEGKYTKKVQIKASYHKHLQEKLKQTVGKDAIECFKNSKLDLTTDCEGEVNLHNSVYIPTCDVLSISQVILNTRYKDQLLAFDDTCFDLVNIFSYSYFKERPPEDYKALTEKLAAILGYKVERQKTPQQPITFKAKDKEIQLGLVSLFAKRFGVLSILLKTPSYLTNNTALFIENIEAGLSEYELRGFVEFLVELNRVTGTQLFITTESQLVYKLLRHIEHMDGNELLPVSVLDLDNGCANSTIFETFCGSLEKDLYNEQCKKFWEDA